MLSFKRRLLYAHRKRRWYTMNTRLGGPQTGRSRRSGEEKNQMKVHRSSTQRPRDCRDAALMVPRKGANFRIKFPICAYVLSSFLFFFLFFFFFFFFWSRNYHHHHHKHQGLGPLIRSVSKVTTALSNVSLVFQLFSFLVVCSSMISKGFGFVAFFTIIN